MRILRMDWSVVTKTSHPISRYGIAYNTDTNKSLKGMLIDSDRHTSTDAMTNTIASAASHTKAVPVLWYLGTSYTVSMVHTTTPAMPAITMV